MRRAIFTVAPGTLPAGDWTRLYFGSEFCPWTFPDTASIRSAIATARDAGLPFTLVTPVVSEPFLPRLKKTLEDILPQLNDDDEVVVSDLGAIRLVRDLSPDIAVAVGRALSGQKRGPRILDLELNDDESAYFRQGSWYAAEAVSFLQEFGIERIELDNLLQGIAPLPKGLSGSLHLPWAMVTSSRNCPYREPGQTGPCPKGCGEVMKLTTAQTEIPLFQAGNTQFLLNESLPDSPSALGIDRIVEHLVLPR